MEEQQKENENNLKTYLEKAPDGVYLSDLKGVFLYGNGKAEEILGYKKEELIGSNFLKLNILPAKYFMRAAKLLALNAMGKNTGPDEFELIRKDKSHIWVEINTAPIAQKEKMVVVGFVRDITKRKQMEEALKASEQNFRNSLDTSSIGINIIDTDFYTSYINQAFLDIFGYKNIDEVRVNPPYKYYTPETNAAIIPRVEKIASGEPVFNQYEVDIIRKDSTIRHLQVSRKEISWDGKQQHQILYNDITERKQAENAMRESEEKYRLIVENSRDVIFTLDATGKVLYISSSVINELGYNPAELIGKSILSLVHPEDTTVVRKVVQLNITGSQNIDGIEFRFRHASGEWRWYFGKSTTVRDANGNFLNFTGIARDITDRRQAEKQLEQVAREWRTTFDSITDLISIHDKDNRIVRGNKAMADLLKTTPQQLVGKLCHEVMHGTKEPPANCPHLQTLKTTKPAAMETFNPNFEIYFHEATSPLFNEKGEVTGSVLVARDVTKQKRMEEQLIMTDRLASIGELSSGIAHELNNPLTSVIGFSQLLMEGDVPANIKDDLAIINSEAQRAAVIVKNLLIFARKHAPVTQLGQINIVIEDVLRLRSYEQKVNNIEVEKHLATDLPEIMMDHFQLQQAFLNIIVNAEFAMLEAHQRGRLVIATEASDGVVRITFTDDGPGITESNLKSIFDPFFTTKEVGKGTGLGLSICHGIVTEHGGKIYARSIMGQGATFVVELPLNRQ